MKATILTRLPNIIGEINSAVYSDVDSYIEILDGMSRLANLNISLLDLHKKEILYTSDSSPFIIPEKETDMILEIILAWSTFLQHLPIEERKEYSLHFNYHLNNGIVQQSLTPLHLNEEGRAWLVVSISKLSTYGDIGNVVVFKNNTTQTWYYSFASRKWVGHKYKLLTDTEQQILRMASLGKKEDEICEAINHSKASLKSIKRKIYEKMEVTNMTQALSFAVTHGMI